MVEKFFRYWAVPLIAFCAIYSAMVGKPMDAIFLILLAGFVDNYMYDWND